MANLLVTAATHGGVISRAISNGKRFKQLPLELPRSPAISWWL